MSNRTETSTIRALCVRTRMIGGGNTYQILIPLEDINPQGQTYQVIRGNQYRPYVLFVDGIEPYTSEIIKMPQGFERYDRFRQHERDTKSPATALMAGRRHWRMAGRTGRQLG